MEMKKRLAGQPVAVKSAGSIFRNPIGGKSAAWYIEQCALKGTAVGDAVISEKHANFLINRGSARYQDIEELIAFVRDRVYKQFSVILELEIRIV